MSTRLCLTVVCCCLIGSVSAQVADFRAAAQSGSQSTVSISLGPTGNAGYGSWNNAIIRGGGARGLAVFPLAGDASKRSGFAVSEDIVVSCALTEDDVLQLTLADGTEAKGSVVARDDVNGLVAIRVEDASLTPIALADASPHAGLPVFVSWLEEGHVATGQAGMIASEPNSRHASLGLTQSLDADFAPHKLGAPILDATGTLVGVMVYQEGTPLCLPASHISRLIDAEGDGDVVKLGRGRMGVRLDEAKGSEIVTVVPDMPAADAGLKAGDRVAKVDSLVCRNHHDVMAGIAMARAGDTVSIEVERDGKTLVRDVELVSTPQQVEVYGYLYNPMRSVYRFQDGKLVPMTGETPVNPTAPQLFLEGIKVERSTLEESLKKLEAEKSKQDEMILKLREKISRMEVDAAEARDKLKDASEATLQEIVEEIRKKLEDERDDN